MRARLGSLAISGLLLVGLLSVAPAARAAMYEWELDQRPSGLPATSEPAQTLVSASALIQQGPDSDLSAGVTLSAEPTAATDAVLRLALGRVVDGVCDELWAVEVSTFEPTGIASRTGSTVNLYADRVQGWEDSAPRCGSVSVLSADGARTVLDRLEEPGNDEVIIDEPSGQATVLKVRNHRVEPGRWTTLWMLIGYEGTDATGFSLYGRPLHDDARFVEAKEDQFRTELVSGSRTWVPVQVRLRGQRARHIELFARPDAGVWLTVVPKLVTIRPTR